jgi:hypothetical protein
MAKVLKGGNKKGVASYLLQRFNLNQHIEKLYYYFIAFIMINHISACFWYFIAKLYDFDYDTWVHRLGFMDKDPIEVIFF